MKNILGLISVLVITLGLLVPYLFYQNNLSFEFDKSIQFEISNGDTFNGVLNKLSRKQPGFSISLAKIYIKLGNLDKSLKVGEYLFKKGESLKSAIDALSSGRVLTYKVTIPEGYNLFEIADLLKKKDIIRSKESFLELVRSPQAAKEFLDFNAASLEGYLYPATYDFSKNTTPYLIVKALTEAHLDVFKKLKSQASLPKGFSHHQLVTLASIVEKETGASFERPLIASVFLNRLKKKMRIQSDPTTIYGEWVKTGERLFNIRKKHLLAKNEYNTYSIRALPVGPISNPGFAAMLAVCQPKASDYLYFVSKNDGTHYFSKSYKEHNTAVKRYQLSRRARKGKSWRDLKNK